MMMSPSSMILDNIVDVYVSATVLDAVSAPQFDYGPPTYPGEPCSVQYVDTGEDVETFGRDTVVNSYHVLFGRNLGLKSRDKIVWREGKSSRTLFVQSNPPSEAGRGAMWVVRAIEKV